MRIAILGIGGVGGFVGARLALRYHNSGDHEIVFIARGEHAEAIRAHGLKLKYAGGEETAHPHRITGRPEELGPLDVVFCCVKSYDLETSLQSLSSCISRSTAMLPLLNGVDASERVRAVFPHTDVLDGCVYIVSRLDSPGTITVSGSSHVLYLGTSHGMSQRLREVESILQSTGVHARVSEDIRRTVWEKFLFISPLATLTSRLDLCLGAILENPNHKTLLVGLMMELQQVAQAGGLEFAEKVIEQLLDRMASLPYETTSSMHSDFKKGKHTEFDSLTAYVVKAGRELNVPTPLYDECARSLPQVWPLKEPT